MNLLQLGIY
uniref:Uncharacterized protein n=1 Tax=Anguilla anguilla TaxID=7936 RepID=A0A0E9VD57_ANGAN